MKGFLLLVHVCDVFLDAAFVEVSLLVGLSLVIPGGLTLIAENDAHSAIEIGQLPQPGGEGGVIENDANGENFTVWLEAHRCAGLTGFFGRLRVRDEAADGSAALKPLAMHLALSTHRHLNPFAKGVHHRDADTVEATRHLVTTGAEFAPGMQNGEHRLQSALSCAGVHPWECRGRCR